MIIRFVPLCILAAAAFPAAGQVMAIPAQSAGAPGGGGADGPLGLDVDWYTIDGGGATFLNGGQFSLGGTSGQPDAGAMGGGDFELGGGFWFGVIPNYCYANCDLSTSAPILNVADFSCFLNSYAAGDSYANCDGSTTPPALNVADFSCFLNAFASGCT